MYKRQKNVCKRTCSSRTHSQRYYSVYPQVSPNVCLSVCLYVTRSFIRSLTHCSKRNTTQKQQNIQTNFIDFCFHNVSLFACSYVRLVRLFGSAIFFSSKVQQHYLFLFISKLDLRVFNNKHLNTTNIHALFH